MTNLINFLKGKKSYLLGLAGIAYAITGYYTGHLDKTGTVDAIWASLSVMALRAGIKNSVRGTDEPAGQN
jgi:hypothetical protein